MKIILFSGTGNNSGKSTAAKLLTQDVWSLAGAIRQELTQKYPAYNWYNKNPDYKEKTIIEEWKDGKYNMRKVLVEYGQIPCKTNPTYWADKLVSYLTNRHFIADGVGIIGVDDVRKLCEVETVRAAFPHTTTHIHLLSDQANLEPEFENEELAKIADYKLIWEK
tara:strand:- start:2210 stop:2704 length:495 start_codon:yes stop_codon:yes gene_type:complete